jgi:hypothetical protein
LAKINRKLKFKNLNIYMKLFRAFYLFPLLTAALGLNAQSPTISGYVKSAATGEELIGANVLVPETSQGTTTNAYGFYSLTLPSGTHSIQVSYLGYETITESIDLQQSTQVNFELPETAATLTEIVVTDKKEDSNVTDVEMSTAKLEVATIKKVPALLGEVDIIKAIQLLPGVSTIGEGATGFNVRGGGIDQNLVLLDEAPVFNQSHLFGFFSVFNPDAVKNVKLYKGGIPAEFGGRASSILDIRMKEGNNKSFSGQGGVGLIFSRLTLEAPLQKDRSSFVVAARRSYIDVLAKPFLNDNLKDSKFYFYDLTAKANYIINDRNRIFLSGYFGRDVFESGFGFNWGNGTGTLRWNSIFSDKLFMNLSAIYSNYDYALGVSNDIGEGFDWNSQIVNYSLKNNYNWFLDSKNNITFGWQATYYDFKPARFTFTSGGDAQDISLENKYAVETAAFVGNEQKINDKLTLEYGLRLSNYNYLGGTTIYEFDPNTPAGERKTVLNSYKAPKGEVVEAYYNLEPRLAANFILDGNSSLKASYNRMAQYLHLASNTAASSPLDIWYSSTNNIRPQLVDQLALGYFRNFNNNTYEASLELYYKNMQNQLGYVDGADLFLNENVEGDLLQGKGRAYGAELYVKKNKGKLTGWLSYTLSRSELKINGQNGNEWYAAKFDKPHNLTLVGIYTLNKRLEFSSTFTFSSGIPATFPTQLLYVDGQAVPVNAEDRLNQQRLTPYHRLDFSVILQGKHNAEKRWQSEWVFGAYNVYARRNAFNLYFRENPDDPSKTEAVRVAILGTILPSVSYNFKF